MNESRVESIDIFRGLGIIIMVMGHIYFGSAFDHFIHAFHMPMFYFVSGIFFDNKRLERMSVGDYVKRKMKTLLIPYIAFGVLHYALWIIWNYRAEIDLLQPLKNLLWRNTQPLPIADALWFLTSLFWTEVIYFVMMKSIKNRKTFHLFIIIMALLGNIEEYIFLNQLPLALGSAFVGLGLYHAGYLLFGNRDKALAQKIFDLPVIAVFLGGIVTIVLIFLNGRVNMRDSHYAVIPLFWINAINSTLIGIHISECMDKKLPMRIKKMITFIGRNSVVYVCLNQLIIQLAVLCAYRVLPNGFYRILAMILTLFMLRVCSLIINNTFLKKMIGR